MENEGIIRLSVFLALFLLLATLETLLPRRPRRQSQTKRWFTNWGITVVDFVTLRLLAIVLPFLAVGAAQDASSQGWGLFNTLDWPAWLEIALAILILDFIIWGQHVVTHKLPILWRLHRVHHADVDMDVTTAIRFHPVEIALSMVLKMGAVYLLGPAVIAVILFEIILNGTAMFNHSNLKLPLALDRVLRLVIVTPDMHRVHHSVHRDQHDSNYGFALSLWDRIFGTYIPQPREGHDAMQVGLEWQDDRPAQLAWSLKLPFLKN